MGVILVDEQRPGSEDEIEKKIDIGEVGGKDEKGERPQVFRAATSSQPRSPRPEWAMGLTRALFSA